jgi:hypothetical protein
MIVVCDIDGCLADVVDFVKEYLLGKEVACPACWGEGMLMISAQRCSNCKGTGKVYENKWDWDEYFKHTLEFKPIEPVIDLIVKLMNAAVSVLFITGRPESNRYLTETWLRRYHLMDLNGANLIMRKPSDIDAESKALPTVDIKMRYYRLAKETTDVFTGPILIIDDEPAVIAAATKEGFTVMQVHGYRVTEKDGIPTNSIPGDTHAS